jgi:endoglycosylceramidase
VVAPRGLLALLFALAFGGAAPWTCVPGVPPPEAVPAGFSLPALHAEPDPVRGGRIVDALGREVLLRGVNVNAYVEYWAYDAARFTTYPLTPEDADRMAGFGWNAVRLLLSWSRVEPTPGEVDEAYLDAIERAVRLLESRGLYSILDLHQDAWGPTLAAREDEACAGIGEPAFGWDGAPDWATLDDGAPRCAVGGTRELSPAVLASFASFFDDRPGPGGVGLRARYVAMLRRLATRFARLDAVAGYDVMNEPNAFDVFRPGQLRQLADFTADAVAAIREGEALVGAPPRLVFFEPSITWAGFGVGALPPFEHDDQVVYAPHLYQGGLDDLPLDASVFQRARDEAVLYGGAPVLSGEWGADPRRAADPDDGYFDRHQALQDEFRFGATLWTWREACGDPHKAGDVRAGRVPFVWGLFDVDCEVDRVVGLREPLAAALRRPLLRAAPGPIDAVRWDAEAGRFEARGEGAARGTSFAVFVPSASGRPPRVLDRRGLLGVHPVRAPGGHHFVVGWARGGDWQLALDPR